MKLRYAVPSVLLVGLLLLFAVGLQLDPTKVPSPLIGKPVPQFELPVLGGGEGRFGNAQLQGRPMLVNFWASWCPPCLQEHPLLMRLAQEGVPIVGMNYKDEPAAAVAWLKRHGNPFLVVASDLDGRVGLDWGVYGAPETYVLDAQGVIRHKHIGPVTESDWREVIAPAMGWGGAR